MCSDSNLSCRTADDEYINLRSESDEAINYIANANNCSAEQQQYIVNCDEYPTIRRSDQCSSEATYQVKNRRWLPSSYTWKVPWILFICSVVQVMPYCVWICVCVCVSLLLCAVLCIVNVLQSIAAHIIFLSVRPATTTTTTKSTF